MSPDNKTSKQEFAVATLLHGDRHFFNAMVLGSSIKARSRDYHSILMVVGDFEAEQLDVLRMFWDEVKLFPDIQETVGTGGQFDVGCNKFYAYTLDTFKKVLLLDANMLVADDLSDVFAITSPATTTVAAEAAWTSEAPLAAEHLLTQEGALGINPGVVLLEPSQLEFEDIVEALQEKHAKEEVVEHLMFLAKYFMGSWYSISHEFNYRPKFVAFGDTRAYGINPSSRPCRVIHFNKTMSPADYYFYSLDFAAASSLMPSNQQELLDRVVDWPRMPNLARQQTPKDRLLGMYKLWFFHADKVIDQIANSQSSALLFKLRPARETDPALLLSQLQAEQNKKTRHNQPKLRFKKAHKIEVTDTSHVTRLPFINHQVATK